MKKTVLIFIIFFMLPLYIMAAEAARSVKRPEITGFGIHAGVGTDVTFVPGFGGGASYILKTGEDQGVEFRLDIYYSSGSSTSIENGHHYTDSANTTIFAVTVNDLFNYYPAETGIFYILGAGAASVGVDWKKESPDDSTYNDSGSNLGAGLLINLGIGGTFGGFFEPRLQLPILIVFSGNGPVRFAPMINLAAGFRF